MADRTDAGSRAPDPASGHGRDAHPPASPESVVEMVGLTKHFPLRRTWADMLRRPGRAPHVVAVDHVDCSITRGEFFGLLGPNGAGKTTIFKLLSTLVVPDEGTAYVCGVDLRTSPERVRALVTPVIADERSLNWRLSAIENLRLFAAFYGLRGDAGDRRIGELLEVVGLEDAGHKIVGAFSSGMKQRLLLARALLSTPRLLLLDEPTRSLDPIAARDFRLFLRQEIVAKHGCTVLLATHNSEEALSLCDRVGVLHGGRMIAVGTPAELNHRVSGVRYRVWTETPRHPAFHSIDHTLSVAPVSDGRDRDGWEVVELALSGTDRPAEVLKALVEKGVSIARFERVQVPLAQLIEGLVRSPDERADSDA